MFRIGHGYDAHTFETDKPLIIGGINIPYSHGLKAHSDGDVLIHAVCDSLLGAAALGDIGKHFPDTDNQFKNIDSRILLKQCFEFIKQKKYSIQNLDITIIAQAPKMSPHIEQMRTTLAEDMNLTIDQVNIKATTTEKMGFTGRKEGISVHSIVLLEKA